MYRQGDYLSIGALYNLSRVQHRFHHPFTPSMLPLIPSLSLASCLYFAFGVVALTRSGMIAVDEANPLTQQACEKIDTILPGRVTFEGSREYTTENKDYWSVALTELKPACITLPISAQEVSIIVSTLNQFPGAKFVVKSGGHDPNPGHSSCSDCVLIAMKKMKGTVNDPAKGVAYVQPGGTWATVITPLVKQGVTVVGGRLGGSYLRLRFYTQC
jgi:hypothetical protein